MSKLTTPQLEAVNHDGHLLIVAGPGSGKTSTSIAKARRILRDPDRSLVMVTFTKEAAEEMRKRLLTALSAANLRAPDESRVLIGTFHSIALRHLKRDGLTKKLLGPQAQDFLYRDAAFACNVDKDDWADVQKGFEQVMYAADPDSVDVSSLTHRVVAHYRKLVAATGNIDLYTVMRDVALRATDGSLAPLPYTDMLVDEGQDTDGLQRMWIFAHARAGCRVTIVGDDDQSIYEWRNALGYEGMKSFLDTFQARRIELGDNFRCRSEVLTPAVTLISRNQKRLVKHLVAKRASGGCMAAFMAGAKQNEMVGDLMEALPEKHTNAAVLARTNRSLDALEIVLRGRGISYTRLGKSIWEQSAIAGYLGLLQTLLDGSPAGMLSVLQLRNIDPSTRHELLDVHRGNVASFLDGTVPDLGSATAADKSTLQAIAKDLSYWRRQLRAGGSHAGGSVREVVLEVAQVYGSWTRNDHHKYLLSLCSEILANRLKGTLSARLQTVQRKQRDEAAKITLMTMHGAKGLEFETVHIIDANKVEDGSTLLHPEAERRLMYVAMTRAKNCAVLWVSSTAHTNIAEADLQVRANWKELLASVSASG